MPHFRYRLSYALTKVITYTHHRGYPAVYFLGDEPENDGNDDETKPEVTEEENDDEIDDKETLWDGV